ncbi:hypothetical protein DPMN_064884 [Dreissena polymorpha]|uniref:Uncharacterized protein n=1 Tax=Dreissena polymorpha TaxID=45954 RepID=A0A9D4CEA1_DREPO|nr:hypothetical protein DPMN_064884 [Dreissena polymorpha]
MPLRQTLTAFTAFTVATFKIILRRYAELLLRFYYDHEDLSTMLPRCLYDYNASTTLFLRLYTDSYWPLSRYACVEHVQNKLKTSLARAYSSPIMKTLPLSYCAYEDSTTFLLRFVTIGRVFGHALIVVEAASQSLARRLHYINLCVGLRTDYCYESVSFMS